jgi:hypothetical protein
MMTKFHIKGRIEGKEKERPNIAKIGMATSSSM